MRVLPNPCGLCSEAPQPLEVPAEGYRRWMSGEVIQVAMPELSDGDRELLMTGTHDACWQRMFAEEEEPRTWCYVESDYEGNYEGQGDFVDASNYDDDSDEG